MTEEAAADDTDVVKALVTDAVPGQTPGSQVRPTDRIVQSLAVFGAISPPYDAGALCTLFEESSALRPCIEAYAANIDGFGHRLEPLLDLNRPDSRQKIAEAIELRDGVEPDAEAVEREFVRLRREMVKERVHLEWFFEHCNPEMSFTELRIRSRMDREITGNAYWEIVRNELGDPAQINHIPVASDFGQNMYLAPKDKDLVSVAVLQRVTPLEFRKMTLKRRFRKFLQWTPLVQTGPVWFRQFGDPRPMSAVTGKSFPTLEALRLEEPNAALATDVIHWPIYDSRRGYGTPRWVGATFPILGLQSSERVNSRYFKDKAVPPLAVLVSGGRLQNDAVEVIRQHFASVKGEKDYHGVLILEAVGQGGGLGNKVEVKLQPLMEAQLKDALFQTYEKNAERKIGQQFRLPDLIRGLSAEVNRAQAMAVLKFVEQQVFQPLREQFDYTINHVLLPAMGIKHWKVITNSAPASDPNTLVELVTQLVYAGVLVPAEGRTLAGEALNKVLATITEPWAQRPLSVTLAMQKGTPSGAAGSDGSHDGAVGGGGAPTEQPNAALATYMRQAQGHNFIRQFAQAQEQAAYRTATPSRAAVEELSGLLSGDEP